MKKLLAIAALFACVGPVLSMDKSSRDPEAARRAAQLKQEAKRKERVEQRRSERTKKERKLSGNQEE